MTEKLTDEQLREWRANVPAEFYPIFDDLLAIRAQSAELQMQRDHHDKFRQEAVAQRDALLVERIELEAALASGPTLSELDALRAERAKPTPSDVALAKEALRLIQWMEQGAHNAFANRPILAAFAALRAERAKPTPSDEERAREIVSWHHDSAPLLVKDLLSAFASIRAEGSAERAKLEAALWAERLELPANEYERGRNAGLEIARAYLAQPAESGATERDDTIMMCANIARQYSQNVDNEYFRNEIAANTCLAIAELITQRAGAKP